MKKISEVERFARDNVGIIYLLASIGELIAFFNDSTRFQIAFGISIITCYMRMIKDEDNLPETQQQ